MPVRTKTHLAEVERLTQIIDNLQAELLTTASIAVRLDTEVRELRRKTDNRPKLTPTQVEQIRAEAATGQTTQRQLAAQYGVNAATVSRIVNRKYHA
jgi:DNA-binding transcriptional regulator YiaG